MATFCHAMAAQSYALGFLGPHLSSEGTGAGTAVHVNPQGRDGEWGLRVSGRTSHHGAPRLPLGETGEIGFEQRAGSARTQRFPEGPCSSVRSALAVEGEARGRDGNGGGEGGRHAADRELRSEGPAPAHGASRPLCAPRPHAPCTAAPRGRNPLLL